MTITRAHLAVIVLLALGVMALMWLLEPDRTEADATTCRANGGSYDYQKHICLPART